MWPASKKATYQPQACGKGEWSQRDGFAREIRRDNSVPEIKYQVKIASY
jgi:hypothetical protein